MFRAIYRFAEFIECAAHSTNSYNARQSINWHAFCRTRTLELCKKRNIRSHLSEVMEDQREKFEMFIREKYIDGDSKTVTKEKLQKITNCLKNDPCAREYCPKFEHWVKQRGFSLMNYGALGLKDIPCLSARSKV